MTSSTDVTFVVVTFNHARWVEQCLDSAVNQTLGRSRVIVIDDASTDTTVSVVNRYMSRHPGTVELLAHTVNQGLGPSLVEGLALVDTTYFGYIAGDDWMEPERLAIQVPAMEAAGGRAGLSYSDVYRADDVGQRIGTTLSERMGESWQPRAVKPYRLLLEGNWIPAPSILLRTHALREVGGYDPELFYEDHDVVLRVARDHDLVFVDTPLATHRELDGSLGNRMFFRAEHRVEWLQARFRILDKHLGGDHDDYLAAEMYRLLIASYMCGASVAWTRTGLRRLEPLLISQPADMRWFLVLARLRVPGRVAARLTGLRARIHLPAADRRRRSM